MSQSNILTEVVPARPPGRFAQFKAAAATPAQTAEEIARVENEAYLATVFFLDALHKRVKERRAEGAPETQIASLISSHKYYEEQAAEKQREAKREIAALVSQHAHAPLPDVGDSEWCYFGRDGKSHSFAKFDSLRGMYEAMLAHGVCADWGGVRTGRPSAAFEAACALDDADQRKAWLLSEVEMPHFENAPHRWFGLTLSDENGTIPERDARLEDALYALRDALPLELQRDAIAVVTAYTVDFTFWASNCLLASSRADIEALLDAAQSPFVLTDGAPCLEPESVMLWLPARDALPDDMPRAGAALEAGVATGLVTGISAFDKTLRAGSLAPDARMFIGAPTGSLKTTFMLTVCENLLDQGAFVTWFARDETPGSMQIRRLQRMGYSNSEAQTPTSEMLAKLDARTFYMTSDAMIEAMWERSYKAAQRRKQRLVMAFDSLQKLECAAGAGRGQQEMLIALMNSIVDCQAKWPAIVIATTEINERGGTFKGSGSLAYTGLTHFTLTRPKSLETGARLQVNVGKSRGGTENFKFELSVDLERQRLTSPVSAGAAPESPTVKRIRAAVLEALAGKPMSKTALEGSLKGGKTIRTVVDALEADGKIVLCGQVYRLAE